MKTHREASATPKIQITRTCVQGEYLPHDLKTIARLRTQQRRRLLSGFCFGFGRGDRLALAGVGKHVAWSVRRFMRAAVVSLAVALAASAEAGPSLPQAPVYTYTPQPGVIDVLTQHNDNPRTGSTFEATLTTSNVRPESFGLLRSLPVQGLVFAQPLYVTGIIAVRNIVLVATAENHVYAFDSAAGAELWHVQVGAAPTSNTNGHVTTVTTVGPVTGMDLRGDYCRYGVAPYIGITGTPVIDKTNGLV